MNDVLIMACPEPKLLQKRIVSGVYRHGDEGLEKRCSKCREYWPADTEFFYQGDPHLDGLNSRCKACYVENRYPGGRRKFKPTEGTRTMSENMQTTTPSVAALNQDWMRRIEAALASGQAPAYEDLEQGVHALLSQAAGIRSVAADAEAAFEFIDQECKLIDVKSGVLSIRLELDCDVFTREGARGAIAARIAVLKAAKQEAAKSAMEAELI